ncbi:MAG: hypothetical protein ABSA97_07330 [Verrucomicrobiia bacterium]
MASYTKSIAYQAGAVTASLSASETFDADSVMIDDSVEITNAQDISLDLGGVIGPAVIGIKNIDPDNFVSIGKAANVYDQVAAANGDVVIVQLAEGETEVHAKADTAPVIVQILAIQRHVET